MVIKSIEPDGVHVILNIIDLMILNNSMNEARECLEDWEFEIRVGATKSEQASLLKKFGELIDKQQSVE